MIRQRLLLLTKHVNHGRISVGEKLEIEVPASGEKFTTELLPDYKLRERGAIGRFYRDANINEGDIAVLIENTQVDGRYKRDNRENGTVILDTGVYALSPSALPYIELPIVAFIGHAA